MMRRTRATWLVVVSILVLAPGLAFAYIERPEGQDEYDNYGPAIFKADGFFDRGPSERPPGPIDGGQQRVGTDTLTVNGVKPGSRVLGGAPLSAAGGSDGASQADTIQANLVRLTKRLR